jgi:hypothetical protein
LALCGAVALACAGARPTTVRASSSTLPEFGQPQGRIIDPSESQSGDLIAYRTLTRDDFQAPEPPAAVRAHLARLGAYTCAQIRLVDSGRLFAKPVRGPNGAMAFRAAPERVAFEALMDRDCSWWNESMTTMPQPYVLEHEQIHFALFELTARGMSSRGDALMLDIEATAPTPKEALEAAMQNLRSVLVRELGVALEEQTRFDEDTSFGFRPELQAQWRELVEAQLAASK